jgi:hypothetical protein
LCQRRVLSTRIRLKNQFPSRFSVGVTDWVGGSIEPAQISG